MMTPSATLPTTAYSMLHDSLAGLASLHQDHLSEPELSDLAIAACRDVPATERTWHGHQLRRRLTEAYRGAGYVLVEGQYDTHGLLDAIAALVAGRGDGET